MFDLSIRRLRRLAQIICRTVVSFQFMPALPSSDKKKVVMVGGYGYRDIGDEAMPRTDVMMLRNLYGDIDIVMLSPDSGLTREYHNETSFQDLAGIDWKCGPIIGRVKAACKAILFLLGAIAQRYGLRLRLWDNARQVLDHLCTCDLLFNVGGGNLNGIMSSECTKKCMEYFACALLACPVILSGQTIGPFYKKSDERFLALALNTVKLITFRDREISRQLLYSIGVRRPLMLDAADDAMNLPRFSRDKNIALFEEMFSVKFDEKMRYVAFNLKASLLAFKGKGRSGALENEINVLAVLGDMIIRQYGATLIFVPTDYSASIDDRDCHRKIYEKMLYKDQALLLERELRDVQLKGLISLCWAAVGVRYHFCVFAASEYVPFAGFASGEYQQRKIKGLADLCGLPECYISDDLEYVDHAVLCEKVSALLDRRDQIASQLKKVVPCLEEKALFAVRHAAHWLHDENRSRG